MDSGQRQGFVAEIVSWETHTRPAAGEYPQAVINEQFPDDIDIFVGMMGSYFGTPTKKWGSGTEEEFQIAYERWTESRKPEIIFYFSNAMTAINKIDADQLQKRTEFQKKIENLGIYYFVYTDIVEFQFDLHNHLSAAIHEVMKGKQAGQGAEAIPQESADHLKNYNELLAKNPVVKASYLLNKSSTHLDTYNKILTGIGGDATRLGGRIKKETKKIERYLRENKFSKAQDSVFSMCGEMSRYSTKIMSIIPKLSNEFSDAIISILRAITTIRENGLEENMPMEGISSTISETGASLNSLIEAIEFSQRGFDGWPDDILDVKIEKQTLVALHDDLISSVKKAISLLAKLEAEMD